MIGDILQPTHLLFVLVVALLVLGPKRLPEVGRALGRTMRDFRAAISGEDTHEPTIPEHVPVEPSAPAPVATPPAESASDQAPSEAADAHGGDSAEAPTVAERQPTAAK